MATAKTREQWLNQFTNAMRPDFKRAEAELPKVVKVSCGFTSKGARSNRIGECWDTKASAAEVPEVFIVPGQSDSVRVGGILIHELIHASGIMNHGKDFKRVALLMGLEGKMTATTEGEKAVARIQEIVAKIGQYPHATLAGGLTSTGPKQSTRLLKAECEGCGCIIRITAKWLNTVGAPTCGCGHDEPMQVAL